MAFSVQKCYFSAKESLISFIGYSDGMTWARVYHQYSWLEYIWLNIIWNAVPMFEAYRQAKYLLEFEMDWMMDYGLVWEPTIERQKQEYLLAKKTMEVVRLALTRRTQTNYDPEFRIDY